MKATFFHSEKNKNHCIWAKHEGSCQWFITAHLTTTATTTTIIRRQRFHLDWYSYHITVCGKHIIMNFIILSILNCTNIQPVECLMNKKLLFFISVFSFFHLQSCKSPIIKIIKRDLEHLAFVSGHEVILLVL
jgi:hypothetical protein